MVPPFAVSSFPSLRDCASVKVPFSYPNSSDSKRSAGMAAQSILTNGLSRRLPHAWIASAKKSLPLPDSPRRRRLTSWSRTFSTVCRSVRIEALLVRTKSFRTRSRCLRAADIRRCGFLAEFGGDVRRIAPQPLQPVKAAAIFGEDVEDEVAVVEQDPAAGRGAFDEPRLDAIVLAKLVDDAVGDGDGLTFRGGRAHEEVVGDRGEAGDREDVEIERFLIQSRGDRGAHAVLNEVGQCWPSLYKP